MLVILPTSRYPFHLSYLPKFLFIPSLALVSLSLVLHSPKHGHQLVALVLVRPARRHSSHDGLGLELGRIVIVQNMKKHSEQHITRMMPADASFSGME